MASEKILNWPVASTSEEVKIGTKRENPETTGNSKSKIQKINDSVPENYRQNDRQDKDVETIIKNLNNILTFKML